MKITFLSSANYRDSNAHDYGDCILVEEGTEFLVYDCGSEAHAIQVKKYMQDHRFRQALVVLSHNDADHYAGIPYLVEQGLVSQICTPLFLQHLDNLLDCIGDKRYKREPLKEKLLEIFSNITDLAEKYPGLLVDSLKQPTLIPNAEIVGPTLDYALKAVANRINNCKSDMIDAETVTNAVSVHVSCTANRNRVLLCGDSPFESIKSLLPSHSVIQLPHHGKPETAEKIFAFKYRQNNTVYLISDNKGSATNGGSKRLDRIGHNIIDTLKSNVVYPFPPGTSSGNYTGRTLGTSSWR